MEIGVYSIHFYIPFSNLKKISKLRKLFISRILLQYVLRKTLSADDQIFDSNMFQYSNMGAIAFAATAFIPTMVFISYAICSWSSPNKPHHFWCQMLCIAFFWFVCVGASLGSLWNFAIIIICTSFRYFCKPHPKNYSNGENLCEEMC